MPDPSRHSVQTTHRTFSILEALKTLGSAGVTEIASHVDLGKSTVHNHLSTLVERGYVIKDGVEYRLSLVFLEFGELTRGRLPVFGVAEPEIDRLASQTGELVNFVMEENGECVYLYRAEGENAVRLDTYAGKRVGMHCTAVGKAILAYLSRERVEEIIERHGLDAVTANTITDREALEAELAQIREEGVAYDDEERLKSLRCVAAPVVDSEGDAIAAVSVSGPIQRMDDERFRTTIANAVLGTANVIELNYTHA